MVPPEADVKGAYYTTIGITLFQMVDQNVSTSHPHTLLQLVTQLFLYFSCCRTSHSQISALAPLGLRTKLKVEVCIIDPSPLWGAKVGKFTWKHACFCAFMFKIYKKAQKHTRFHVFSPFRASFYPPLPLHHSGRGSTATVWWYCERMSALSGKIP